MGYFGVGGREVWSRFVVPPASSAWRWARDLVLLRRRRDSARSGSAAKLAERRRDVTSWQESQDR